METKAERFVDENGVPCVRVPVYVCDNHLESVRRRLLQMANGEVVRDASLYGQDHKSVYWNGGRSPIPPDRKAIMNEADWEALVERFGPEAVANPAFLTAQPGYGVGPESVSFCGGFWIVVRDRTAKGGWRRLARLIKGLGKSQLGKRKMVRYLNRNRFDLRRSNLVVEAQVFKRRKQRKAKEHAHFLKSLRARERKARWYPSAWE